MSHNETAEFWITSGLDRDGFEMKFISDLKGFGVRTTQSFERGEFLLQYTGSRLNYEEGKARQMKYEKSERLLLLKSPDAQFWIDPTETPGQLGPVVNDGVGHGENCEMKFMKIKDTKFPCLFAKRDIDIGEELLFDYKDLFGSLWWRKKTSQYLSESLVSSLDLDCNPFDVSDDEDELFDPNKEKDEDCEDWCEDSSEMSSVIDSKLTSGFKLPMLSLKSFTKKTDISKEQVPVMNGTCDALVNEKNDPVVPVFSDNNPVGDSDLKVDINTNYGPQEIKCTECGRLFRKRGAYTMHIQSHSVKAEVYKKPRRLCPFCGVDQANLNRHIRLTHKKEPDVAMALSYPKGSAEKNSAFENFKKEGIFKHNLKQAQNKNPQYTSERRGQANLVCCSKCKGFYGKKLFLRHKKTCMGDTANYPSGIPLQCLSTEIGHFEMEVLGRFQKDDAGVGLLCTTDKTIILIGRRLFQKDKKKINKTMESRKTVMADMRLLGRLFLKFQESLKTPCRTAADMFIRKNFKALEEAITDVSTDKENGKLKYGTKNSLYYLLKTSCKILIAHHLSEDEDEKAKEVKNFQKVLELNQNIVFGDATYAVNMSRQTSLRMPEMQANEEDVTKLHKHLKETIERLSSPYQMIDQNMYVKLRDSLCARITLFNARRGGEPSSILIENWKDAKNGRWVDSSSTVKLLDEEKNLFRDMFVGYEPGKCNKLVPILFPKDSHQGLDILCDDAARKEANVAVGNKFVFPNTQQSPDHVIGWPAINKMSLNAGVARPDLLGASKQRHRVSTLYAALEIPRTERQYFYKHMGHTEENNEGTYQYPLPILEVTKVGRHLLDFDRAVSLRADDHEKTDLAGPNIPSESGGSPPVGPCEPTPTSCSGSSSIGHISQVRSYYRWKEEETALIRQSFGAFLSIKAGNPLPSKAELIRFVEEKKLGCSWHQLRTKVMNEQNRIRKVVDKRMKDLMA